MATMAELTKTARQTAAELQKKRISPETFTDGSRSIQGWSVSGARSTKGTKGTHVLILTTKGELYGLATDEIAGKRVATLYKESGREIRSQTRGAQRVIEQLQRLL